MNGMKTLAGLLALLVVLPCWFYVQYQILTAIEATELTWFIFWAYVPASMFVTAIGKITGD